MSAEPEDDLLRQLGERQRERSAGDAASRSRREESWDRLAAGELSAAEEAELAELARRSPDEAERLAAFQPLGDAFHERLVGALTAQREGERAAGTDERVPARLRPPRAPEAGRGRRWRRAAALASSLAAAVVGFVVLRPPAPLPLYVAKLQGATQPVRGAESGAPPIYSPGSTLTLVLQPAQKAGGAVRVRCRIARAGVARTEDWPPCARALSSDEGSLRVSGTVGADIPYEPGVWTLWAIVERAGLRGRLTRPSLPADEVLLRLAPGATLRRGGQTALRLREPLRFEAL